MFSIIGNKNIDLGRRSAKVAPVAASLKLAAQGITLPVINHDIQDEV